MITYSNYPYHTFEQCHLFSGTCSKGCFQLYSTVLNYLDRPNRIYKQERMTIKKWMSQDFRTKLWCEIAFHKGTGLYVSLKCRSILTPITKTILVFYIYEYAMLFEKLIFVFHRPFRDKIFYCTYYFYIYVSYIAFN